MKIRALSSGSAEDKSVGNTVTVNDGKNFGIIANQVNIKTSARSRVGISAPDGTIGSHRDERNYVKYLIDRYHEFKRADVGAEGMKYSIIYDAIKNKFGTKWDYIPSERFEQLVVFIQKRIDSTIVGKNKKSKGIMRYQTYGGYLDKHVP